MKCKITDTWKQVVATCTLSQQDRNSMKFRGRVTKLTRILNSSTKRTFFFFQHHATPSYTFGGQQSPDEFGGNKTDNVTYT